jgi:predicted nucleic acid-binding protein
MIAATATESAAALATSNPKDFHRLTLLGLVLASG